jgi:hypothetical protein
MSVFLQKVPVLGTSLGLRPPAQRLIALHLMGTGISRVRRQHFSARYELYMASAAASVAYSSDIRAWWLGV